MLKIEKPSQAKPSAVACWLIALGSLIGPIAVAAPVTVYANSAQEPKAYVDSAGKVRGFAVETAEAILKDAGVEHVFVGQPFPRAFEETKACHGLMVGIFKSEERQQFLAYSAEIVPDKVALVTKVGSPFVYTKLDDLKGKSIAFLRGGYFGIDMKQLAQSTLDGQVKADVMLLKLLDSRVDVAIISPVEGVQTAARAAGISMSQLTIAKEPVAVVPNHIVGCKSDSAMGELLRKLDKSIAKLKVSGEIDRIMKKYAAAN